MSRLIDCYHCGVNKAGLKCSDCDSEIFRFCSNDCGADAHDHHSAVCYNRKDAAAVEEHLYDAIEEMQDPEDIADAMEVASYLAMGGEDAGDVLQEAHEIIQTHITDNGLVLVEARTKMSADQKSKRALARAARRRKAQARAQRRRENLAKRRANRAARKQRSDTNRAARYQKRQARAARKQQRYANRAQNPGVTKPGMRERFQGWNEKRHDKAATREEQRARDALGSGDDSSGGN